MSKELTPLEAFKRFKDNIRWLEENTSLKYYFENNELHFKEDLDIIETIINEKINIENRLDEIFENHNIKSFTELNERLCDYNELKFDDDIKQKKLKELEIIKQKVVNVKDFIFYLSLVDQLGEENIIDLCCGCSKTPLTKEEFDLLKEELVDEK